MKFTEGYWEQNERANAIYAVEALVVEEIPGGMKVVAPTKKLASRWAALDTPTITTEFTSQRKDVISVRSYHYEAYQRGDMRFELNLEPQDVKVEITDKFAVMKSGRMVVRVDREEFKITYEADGQELTSIGFRNQGYMQYDKKIASKFPGEAYLRADYQPYMVTELSLGAGECVYGLGERFTAFVKNGQAVDIWNEDGGTSSQMAYKNIPFYVTNKHYGIYVDHSDNVSLEVASEKVESVGFSVPGEELRYHVIYSDDLKGVLKNYTSLTGKPALVPAWSFGLWLSTSFTTNYDEETTSSFIQGMKERNIPLDVFHFDCNWLKTFHWCDFEWNEETFPDVKGMLARYKERGLKISVWINPYVAQGTKTFREAVQKGYLLMRADGKGVWQTDTWQPGMGIVDFTNPGAVTWFQEKIQSLLDVGVDTIKTDFGERIPTEVTYYNGANPESMHNYYTLLYNKAVFTHMEKQRGKNEVVLFARSATVGSQQYPIHWGGDNSASYASMAESLRGGLSLTMSGFGYWSHDIGGFELTATPDLFKRWLQFGLLSTHSRLHGSKSYRVPWLFDDEANDVCREFTELKIRLMPYVFGKAKEAHETGVPVMRSMILEFEKDPATAYLDMQYMLGDKLLVAPIFNDESKGRYYLPQGRWTHFLSGEVKEGEKWYEETFDYFSLPLFARENSLIPMGTKAETAQYDYTKDVQIQVFELVEGKETNCFVTDDKGEVKLEVKASKENGKITLSHDKALEGLAYLLRNVDEIQSIENGDIEKTAQGLLIKPQAGQVTIILP